MNPSRNLFAFPVFASSVSVLLPVLLSLAFFSGCERPKSAGEQNVIKEYVNTPKERAVDVKNKLESAQGAAAVAAKDAMHDDDDLSDEASEEEDETSGE